MSNFISDNKFDLILNLIEEGFGIREISRTVGVSRNTVRPIWCEFWNGYGKKPSVKSGGYWYHKKHTKRIEHEKTLRNIDGFSFIRYGRI